ncbi:MAG: hypothetical protein ABEK04_06105 [Candidatus Nanohalobium sp.]
MDTNLKRKDIYYLVAGLLAVALLASASYVLKLPQLTETLLDGFSTVAGLTAAYFVYRGTTESLGGEIGKATAMLGFGIVYYTITLIPHVIGHLSGFRFLPVYFFQHTLAAWSFVMVTYGSYRFWRGGKE